MFINLFRSGNFEFTREHEVEFSRLHVGNFSLVMYKKNKGVTPEDNRSMSSSHPVNYSLENIL